jgi:hypothetical protein
MIHCMSIHSSNKVTITLYADLPEHTTVPDLDPVLNAAEEALSEVTNKDPIYIISYLETESVWEH